MVGQNGDMQTSRNEVKGAMASAIVGRREKKREGEGLNIKTMPCCYAMSVRNI